MARQPAGGAIATGEAGRLQSRPTGAEHGSQRSVREGRSDRCRRTKEREISTDFGGGFDEAGVRALPGPSWLAERRLAALRRAGELSTPTSADEEWRYSRIDEFDLGRFRPMDDDRTGEESASSSALGDAGSSGPLAARSGRYEREGPSTFALPIEVSELVARLQPAAGVVAVLDGVVEEVILPLHEGGGAAVSVSHLLGGELESQSTPAGFGSLSARSADRFVELGEAFLSDAVLIEVAPGGVVEEPIVVVHHLSEGASGRAAFPRTFVSLGRGARATVIEVLTSSEAEHLVVPTTELLLGEEAHLGYYTVQLLGRNTWQFGLQASEVAKDASLSSFTVALGGSYARHRTTSALPERGGRSELMAAYLGDGDQMQDFRTLQEHRGPRTTSDLVFKGAVADRACSVYSGLIQMRAGAKGATAFQTNRNLVLSEQAHADSVPNLDIEENDVRCSHASAVGPIDAEQRFYLESRGVPAVAAEQLILLGFFDELLARIPVTGLRRFCHEMIAQRATRMAASERSLAAVGGR